MRSLFLLGALSAFFVGALAAQQTVVVTSAGGAGGTGRFADGTAWPTTGGFTFQIGLFPAGFDPAKEARATWAAAWTPLRPTVAQGAVDAWFLDGSQALFSLSGTTGGAGATAGGEQYYVWGATTRSARPGAEWILLTNPAWRVVAGQTARLPDLFATTDAGTVAVFGECGSGGRALQSAPAFPGELRLMGQTADFAVVAGEPATLSVKAGGSGFAYQWYAGRKGDTSQPLPRARQATYTLPSVPRTATFWVRLTDGVSSIDSESTTVTATAAGTGTTATHSFVVGARPGAPVEIRAEVSFEGAPGRVDLAALLPPGWQLVGSDSAGARRRPAAGATDLIEWSWAEGPASPVRLRYTVLPPPGLSGAAAITALVTVERDGMISRHLVSPEPLRVTTGTAPLAP
jgi:hypothetical protein